MAGLVLSHDATVNGQKIIAHCRQRVPAYRYSRTVECRDSLPKTAIGKVASANCCDTGWRPTGEVRLGAAFTG